MKKARRIICIVLLLILGTGLFWAFGPTFAPKIRISQETTYLTSPLTPDGRVDYVRAINDQLSAGVTPENNFIVAHWRIVGPPWPYGQSPEGDALLEQMFLKLQMEPPAQRDHIVWLEPFAKQEAVKYDLSSYKAVEDYSSNKQEAQAHPWTSPDYPMLVRWLELNQKPLDAILDAAQLPQSYAPCITTTGKLIDAALPATKTCRDLADLLCVRANYHLGRHEIDAAWQDLLACHRIARHVSRGWCGVDLGTAAQIESLACQVDWHLIHHAATTSQQLISMREQFKHLEPQRSSAEVLEFERYALLSLAARWGYQVAAGEAIDGKEHSSFEGHWGWLSVRRADWNQPLILLNQKFDQLTLAIDEPTYPRQAAAIAEFEKGLDAMGRQLRQSGNGGVGNFIFPKTSGRSIAVIFCWNMFPSAPSIIKSELRGRLHNDLTSLAIALELHRREHDKTYPSTLTELAGAFLPGKLPHDLFTNEPLKYRLEDAGYVLYSVGPNGEDETQSSEPNPEGDDIVIDFRNRARERLPNPRSNRKSH